jgi:phosphomannomutase/phosphoglucomutase
MHIADSIFRTYDIRGIYPTELDEQTSEVLGKGFGSFFKTKQLKNIVVGRDNRPSSPSLAKSFVEGLLASGCNVTYIDQTITPVIHFLTCTNSFDAGIMVTASHNPQEFNGLRPDYKHGLPLYGKDLQHIKELIEQKNLVTGEGILLEQDLNYLYIDYLAKLFSHIDKFNVMLDLGNGSASDIAPKLFKQLNQNITLNNANIAGGFDLGIPDPENPMMMDRLAHEMKNAYCDVGFAYDEDADRFGLVDSTGATYNSDKLLMLFAKFELREKAGTVIFDVKSTQQLFNAIASFGGVPKMIKTGHPYFVQEMKHTAVLGGEFSGHFFFGNAYFGYDDGIYASLKILEIMSFYKRPLSNLLDEFPKTYHTTELKVDCSDETKFVILAKIAQVLEDIKFKYKSYIALDGIRVNITETGWFLIRASNTSPYISVRLEGETYEEACLLKERLFQMLAPFGFTDLGVITNAKIFYS